jgi:transcriptional regulator with XRE-family HTH domain
MENSSETARRISKALKRVMFEYEISGKQLAELSGIHEGQISDFRRAKRVPNLENFLKLLESLPDEAQEYYINLLLNKDKKNKLKLAEKSNTSKV